jgi:hypothetical protein
MHDHATLFDDASEEVALACAKAVDAWDGRKGLDGCSLQLSTVTDNNSGTQDRCIVVSIG